MRVRLPASLYAAAGLVLGFAVARSTRREIGGAVWAAGGVLAARQWWAETGPVGAAVLSAVYAGAMGGSHPLARRIGGWPSVFAVTGLTAVLSELLPRLLPRR